MVIGGLGPDLYLGEDDTRNGRVGLSFYGGLSHIGGFGGFRWSISNWITSSGEG